MPVPANSGFKQIDDTEIQFNCRDHTDMDAALKDADRAVVLVHHIDLISVEGLRPVNEHLKSKSDIPYLWVLLKLEDESEFKISCIECGQKILIPDGRKDANARCPKCKKAFTIPGREEHLRLVMGFEDYSNIFAVEEASPETFERVIDRLVKEDAAAKPSEDKQTKIRIRKRAGK